MTTTPPPPKTLFHNSNLKIFVELAILIFMLGGIWYQIRDLPEQSAAALRERAELRTKFEVLVERMDRFVEASARDHRRYDRHLEVDPK